MLAHHFCPADDSGYGFDNIGDVLSVSPALLGRYLSAAQKILGWRVGTVPSSPDSTTYDVSRFLKQDGRIGEDQPFGSRGGGAAILHYFPANAEYVIKVRLRRSYDGERVLGLTEPSQIEVRLDGTRIKTFTITPTPGNQDPDAGLEVRSSVTGGTHRVSVAFQGETQAAETNPMRKYGIAGIGLRIDDIDEPAVGSITLVGPYNPRGAAETPSRRTIFICKPATANQEEACARKIFSNLARRAYRRPVSDSDVAALVNVYNSSRAKGNFEAGIEMALQRLLISPEFLFRIERDPGGIAPGTEYRISDLELASRLSFFLWSSIPDDELLGLASQGKLKDHAVLEQQVSRMLADARSKALVDNFAGQWLHFRNVRTWLPDAEEYSAFDENLRDAFLQEMSAVRRQHDPRRSRCSRSAERGLHVRE